MIRPPRATATVSPRVLVTGGAGFIGFHLARLLAEAGDTVTLADDLAHEPHDRELERLLAMPNVRLVRGDLTRSQTWTALGTGYDEVYHLAAVVDVEAVPTRPYAVLRVTADATLRLLEWMAEGGGRRLLFATTGEVHAWSPAVAPLPVPTPEDVPLAVMQPQSPRSAYAGSEIYGELLVTHGCAAGHLPFVIVRLHDVYGPRMGRAHVIPQLWARARGGENPIVVPSSDHSRAFCYVTDAVRACVAAMRTAAAAGRTINIGNDREEIAIGELAFRLLRAARIEATLVAGPSGHDPVARRCPALGRARSLLRYEPEVPLEDGLRRTLAWYADAAPAGPADRLEQDVQREVLS